MVNIKNTTFNDKSSNITQDIIDNTYTPSNYCDNELSNVIIPNVGSKCYTCKDSSVTPQYIAPNYITNSGEDPPPCGTLGYTSTDGSKRLYTYDECKTINGTWGNSDNTCTNAFGNNMDASTLCAPLNSITISNITEQPGIDIGKIGCYSVFSNKKENKFTCDDNYNVKWINVSNDNVSRLEPRCPVIIQF